MINESEIKKYKELINKVNEEQAFKQEIKTTIKNKKEQAKEILKNYGYDSLSDIAKLQEKVEKLQEKILLEQKEIQEELIEISKLREECDKIL
jgi:hypothetical protein